MSELIAQAKQSLLTYRLAIVYGCLFSVNALATAIVASFMNTNWNDLNATSKFLLVVVVTQNWAGQMLAFLNKTMARIQNDQPPIQTGDTQQFRKPDAPPDKP